MSNPILDELEGKDNWLTPDKILDPIKRHYNIDLDPCAGRDTEIASTNWSIHRGQDGLKRSWEGFDTVFVNPPFSQKVKWIDKVTLEYQAGNVERVFLISPDSTDVQSWWHGANGSTGILDESSWVWFSEGRVKYIDAETGEKAGSPSFNTALVFYGDFSNDVLNDFHRRGWLVPNDFKNIIEEIM